jgi:hypothetical protein
MNSRINQNRLINYFIATTIGLIFGFLTCFAQKEVLYKKVDSSKLFMEVLFPDTVNRLRNYPAIVFFHGGMARWNPDCLAVIQQRNSWPLWV